MFTATIVLDPAFSVAPVNRRLFGGFVEHMGRCVYTGLYEPDHPRADEDGLRTDVLDLVRELGVTVVRYPGGNFVSGYRWEDGVGPAEDRPTRLDPAWRSVESNQFGLGEFVRWCRKAEIEPMLAMNLGTRGTAEAIELWEYCNHPGGTYWSDLRRRHGAEEPYAIRMWCLGNEMDGPWQLGHKSAEEYGRLAATTARALRQFDADLELVACGSSHRQMPSFGSWEATVLEHAYDEVDFISAHAYYENRGDLASFLASSVNLDVFIADVVATADHVRARLNKSKRISISFDEWNVWYLSKVPGQVTSWQTTPRISEEAYTLADGVVVGSMLITLLRHSDRVTSACLAQLVNTIAPIHAEPGGAAWRQSTFYPFALTARHARGEVLRVEPVAPLVHTELYGDVPVIDATATRDPATGETTLFLVNRHTQDPVRLEVRTTALGPVVVGDAAALTGSDPAAANSESDQQRVVPASLEVTGHEGLLTVELPAVSWAYVRLDTA
ncbi:MAG TPA: alpha-N-arabinofuranosidase [Propionibacteriaceae bacterium]|jgi:alpha-N-arabinofuranosidase|nr:alpha-N-arabinofuranosidase [Propionibacteriaceae bacterium]